MKGVAMGAVLAVAARGSFAAAQDEDMAALKARLTEMEKRDQALQSRVTELEGKEEKNWMTQQRANEIRAIVEETIADAKKRSQFADGPSVGYDNGFFIKTPDNNFKLVFNGYAQVRYEYAYANINNNDTTLHGSKTTAVAHDPGNSSGIDIRRARISFSGNAFSPNVTFKLEGDFYGGGTPSGGSSTVQGLTSQAFFQVTDAYIGYRFTDQFKIRAGSYKVPFAKAELTADPYTSFMERAEVLAPFDPVRALGVSLYGDIVNDKLAYEVAMNDGGNTNTLRSDDAVSTVATGNTPNLDNRFAYYARTQWAGAGKISEFADEADLRKDNSEFIWLLGAAAGYESQTAALNAFPSPQTTTTANGLTTGGNYFNYTLNGNAYRGTIDWSAKWHGASFLAAAYLQQINATNSPGGVVASNAAIPATGGSFFQDGGYGQIGYMIIPQKLELVGRGGVLDTEGSDKLAQYYSAGANYYLYGQNLKIQSDVTYTPDSAFTSATGSLLANTQDLLFRVQLQLKF
jgi:hypothetical protein